MTTLEKELRANLKAFTAGWNKEAQKNWASLNDENAFFESYARLSAFSALKTDVVLPSVSVESRAFIIEAHNDALTSHVLAGTGAWRASLKSLRSCIENCLAGLYYTDHPIEYRLWSAEKFKTTASAMFDYFGSHPDLTDASTVQSGVAQLIKEYSTLSRAVHGSSANFRMTDAASEVLLWSDDKTRLGMWSTREHKTIGALSCLICFLFRTRLTGTQHSAVRDVLRYALSSTQKRNLKGIAKITIS
jgi:hypothetical protein